MGALQVALSRDVEMRERESWMNTNFGRLVLFAAMTILVYSVESNYAARFGGNAKSGSEVFELADPSRSNPVFKSQGEHVSGLAKGDDVSLNV